MKRLNILILVCSLLGLMALPSSTVLAHQPYCEQADLTADNPWQVPDATISYAYFGSLYPDTDIDYFMFDADEGQSVLLSISIPAYEGAEDYAPVMAVMGPGIEADPSAELPAMITIAPDHGAMMVPVGDEPEYWFEPFGRQYYYNWDNYFFKAPEAATYTVVMWHPEGELGRYSFVIGEEEIRGGDPQCFSKMGDFWTPLTADENPYPEGDDSEKMAMETNMETSTHLHADGSQHDHSQLLEVDTELAPFVDLQVIPLDDGTYNVRIQTLNFTFAPQNIGMDPTHGEGHAHLYIDGVKIARIYSEWFHLESLPEDAEMISAGLYANNHQPIAVDGVEITDMVMVDDITSTNRL